MAEWLVLRLPRAPDQAATWIVADARGATLSPPQSGPLSLAAARAGGRRVCVVVPGPDVLLASPEVPAKAGAKLAQIVPYALEEQLADDIDNLHFAVGKRKSGSTTTPVAVVARSLMDEWLETLKADGITPEAMYADSDLLPENPGHAVALLESDTVTVRPPTGVPITMPSDALLEALELARPAGEITEPSGRGLILYTGAEEWQQYSQLIEPLRDKFDGIKVQLLTGGPLSLLAQQLPAGNAINLLQGIYTPQTAAAVGWRAWRTAAILFACLVGLHLAGKGAQLAMLSRAERAVDASIAETFRSAMPGEVDTTNARRRMEQRLIAVRGGASGSGLLSALGALVEARSAAPGTTVQSMSYREGTLDLRLAAPNADSIDRINQALRSAGWQADLTSGNVVGNNYEGRVQIKAPAGAS